MKAQCVQCGAWFESKHLAHVLCGDRCAHARWVARGKRAAPATNELCLACGSLFLRANPKGRFCSARCKNRSTANRHETNDLDRTRQREWARAHRADNTRRAREWAARYPERRRIIALARRARELGAPGRWTVDE